MKPRKKNASITFIFSFIPGAAEMYMGFMKSGLSLLLAFVMPFLITGMIYGADPIALLSGIIYCVAFFHARNIATAPDDEFSQYEDKYIWEEFVNINASSQSMSIYKKWTATAIIFVGACGLWTVLREYLFKALSFLPENNMQLIKGIANGVPRLAFSILIIAFGVILIRGKKNELTEEKEQ